jgi:hypothetical protein
MNIHDEINFAEATVLCLKDFRRAMDEEGVPSDKYVINFFHDEIQVRTLGVYVLELVNKHRHLLDRMRYL